MNIKIGTINDAIYFPNEKILKVLYYNNSLCTVNYIERIQLPRYIAVIYIV